MIFRSTIVAAAMMAAHPAAAEDHRFEADPVATVHENFVACEVLSQLQRVLEKSPRLARRRMCPTARRRTGTHASIPTTRSRPANGRTRKYCRNETRRTAKIRTDPSLLLNGSSFRA